MACRATVPGLKLGYSDRAWGCAYRRATPGKTRLDGSGLPGSNDLFFDDLATLNLRLFANLDELFGSESPALNNVRVSLRADNVFDAQRQVTDSNGDTPINYQPFLIDPVGRFIGIDIRKLF